ncbi:MAG: T9SS type A sorting domain-containing protein [Chitinophagaceae bacterium]|nr:T9SS type A sorting domain-containing protein [Chitinophagaceae bacterium]
MKTRFYFTRVLKMMTFSMLLFFFVQIAQAQYTIATSSFLGDAGSTDKVTGSRIQSNGTIVLAAIIGAAQPGNKTPVLLNNATSASAGAIIRLSADGKTVLSVTRVAAEVLDVALDNSDNIYVAAGTGGLLKLNATASTLTWARLPGIYVYRVDAGSSGNVVALKPSNISTAGTDAGSGTVYTFQTNGTQTGSFTGHRNTQDVAIDEASQTVILIGWRQANAFDGNRTEPVQIAYIRGYSYTGTLKWNDYDWSTDVNSPDFINRPENNMADTRGYRCAIGGDGKLYAAFEVAGGNHIFRYSTNNITTKVSIVGGDKYHQFFNTKSEHKTFFGRYEPSTGAYVRGQQLTNRLPDGAGNTIRVRNGAIGADATGRVYLGGSSASGLPITNDPLPAGSYSGGGWFMIMSSDFTSRLLVTRVNTSGEIGALDARVVSGSNANFVWGGLTKLSGLTYISNAIQGSAGGGTQDGFFATGKQGGTTPPPATTSLNPSADAYVRSGSYGGTNYGTATELISKRSGASSDGYGRESYLKFDLSSVTGTISQVKLRLYGNLNDNSGADVAGAVYPVTSSSWTESGITWNTKPAYASGALATTIVTNTTPRWYEWDITAYIQGEKAAGRNIVSFVVRNPSITEPYSTFASKEAAANRPVLEISTGTAARVAATEKEAPVETTQDLQQQATVYPVPARDRLAFRFIALQPQAVTIKLQNTSGQLVSNTVTSAVKGQNQVSIPVSSVNDGIYYLSAIIDGKSVIKKIVVKK